MTRSWWSLAEHKRCACKIYSWIIWLYDVRYINLLVYCFINAFSVEKLIIHKYSKAFEELRAVYAKRPHEYWWIHNFMLHLFYYYYDVDNDDVDLCVYLFAQQHICDVVAVSFPSCRGAFLSFNCIFGGGCYHLFQSNLHLFLLSWLEIIIIIER